MTGEQLEITHGNASAVVNTVGAALRAFEVAGVPYVEPYAGDPPPLGAGGVLVPWPNRVAGATWRRDNVTHQLSVTEPARGNAIHGLVRKRTWTVTDKGDTGDAAVTLQVDVDGAEGWPFPFRTSISYALADGGLTVTHTVANRGEQDMPFGVGTHPYPRPGNVDIDECRLTLAARTVLPVDLDSMIPTGAAIDVTGTDFDFSAGRALRDVELDTAFGGCKPGPDRLVRHSVTSGSVGVEL
ncbi:MAG: aldose epimerase, partial [Pseudonocardiaceae bacterium]|nr:aldose epimerase [Pseudonocardiaceae bacterium]